MSCVRMSLAETYEQALIKIYVYFKLIVCSNEKKKYIYKIQIVD